MGTLVLDQVSVEIDASFIRPSLVLTGLAMEGFMVAEPIPHACSERRVTYALTVPSADDATLERLRSISGVRAARKLYRSPETGSFLVQTDKIIVRGRPGVSDSAMRALLAAEGCEVVETMGIGVTFYVAHLLDEVTEDAVACAGRLAASDFVALAQPNLFVEMRRAQATDLLYPRQWHLDNRGQTGGTPGADVRAAGAWQVTLGEGAVVAVLDDAIDWQHPDLVNNVVARYDFVNDDLDPSPFWHIREVCVNDCDSDDPFERDYCDLCNLNPAACETWHGTATACLAVASANEIGVRGAAPMSGLVAVAMLDADMVGTAQSFYYAERNGAHVISNSWGGLLTPTQLVFMNEIIQDVSQNGRGGLGVLVMFSSGNSSTTIDKSNTMALLPDVMAIGATLKDDRITCYSSFGEEQSVVAPGGGFTFGVVYSAPFSSSNPYEQCYESDIITTDVTAVPYEVDLPDREFCTDDDPPICFDRTLPFLAGCLNIPAELTGYNPPGPADLGPLPTDLDNVNYTQRFSGTSAACPIAAGVAALVFSVDNTLAAEQVRNIIEHTADKVHAGGAGYDLVTGHSIIYGHGRVNADRAVRAAMNGRLWPSPVTSMRDNSISNRVFFDWENPVRDVDSVLVVRAVGDLNWTPVDGQEYVVGQQVAARTIIVANDLTTNYIDDNAPDGDLHYAVFTKNTGAYYSWGRRVSFGSKSVPNAPLASVTATPSAGSVPLTVLFSGGAIDPQGREIVTYAWDFGDASTGSGPSVEHTYTTLGQYLAKLTVRNSLGYQGTATILVRVEEAKPAVEVNFTVTFRAIPTSGAAPLTVLFEARVAPFNTPVASYTWDFGDGSGQTTTLAGGTSHVYASAGSYTATVTVRDTLGASLTVASSITVTTGAGSQAARETNGTLTTMPCGAGAAQAAAVALMLLAALRFVGRRRH
ncbi:MAG: S8 family serine peptidase [Phycisphaerae bacterium]|nr:S8 family serine peptidase [Phycisphaerae bacterium]